MLSGAASFNSDLSRWNVSQGEKFVSLMLATYCLASLSCTLALSNSFNYYTMLNTMLIMFIVCFYSNQYLCRLECFLKQSHSTPILVDGMFQKEKALYV